MYANFNDFSYLVPGPLAVFCAIVGYRLGQAVYRPTVGSLRRSVSRSRRLWWIVVALAVVDVALVAGMWSYGWVFATTRVLVALPLILVPLVVALVLGLPRMRRLVRGGGDPDSAPDAALRAQAADPKLVVPVQATAVGGLLSFFVVFVARPVPPYATIAAVLGALLILAAAVLWVRQQRTQRRVGGQSAPQGPGLGVRLLRTAGALVVIAGLLAGGLVYAQASSALPGRYSMGSSAKMDFGGGTSGTMADIAASGRSVSVPQLTGDDTSGTPDEKFTLTAEQSEIRLSSGKVVDAWTYNGQVPGPELRVHQGDLVQVTLINNIPGIGVTLHWHGVDVPNAEDGVPGVTQNAVAIGQSFTYTFRVHQLGTFWYHSHQNSNIEVGKGLFGALIIGPKQPQPPVKDITVFAHQWSVLGGLATLNDADELRRTAVPAGTAARLRLINTSSKRTENKPTELAVPGTSFAVAAVDGTDLHHPGALAPGTLLPLGAGGRYDVSFTMPDHPVRLTDLDNPAAGLVLSPDGMGTLPAPEDNGPRFDPAHYGVAASTPFNGRRRGVEAAQPADGFRMVTGHLAAHYTVVIYDRRGFSHSELDGPQDYDRRVETDADDVRRLIEHLSDEPATVLGASSGGIVVLETLTCHPSVVRTLVPFEPPAVRQLPEGHKWEDFFVGLYDLYRQSGIEPALQKFREQAFAESDQRFMARASDRKTGWHVIANAAYWFEHELRQYPAIDLDLDALTPHADRIVPVVGGNRVVAHPTRSTWN